MNPDSEKLKEGLEKSGKKGMSLRALPILRIAVNLSDKLAPKLQFWSKIVLETLFRLSKLVNRNRVSLPFHSKIEIFERESSIFSFFLVGIVYKILKLTHRRFFGRAKQAPASIRVRLLRHPDFLMEKY